MSTQSKKEKFDLGKLLDDIIKWMQTIGVKLPDTAAKTTKVIGSLVFSAVDIVSGALGLGWVFRQLTPPEFIGTANGIAWGLSIAMFFVVRSLVDDGDGRWWSGPSLFGWMLNIIDSFIDASTAFILFGLGSFLLKPGIQALKDSVQQMPFLGWFIWALLFIISLTSEHWRESMKPKDDHKDHDDHEDHHEDHEADHHDEPADPHHDEPASTPAGKTPPAEKIFSISKIQADKRKMFPVWDDEFSPAFYKLALCDADGKVLSPIQSIGYVKAEVVPPGARPKAPVAAPPPPV